MGLGSLVNPECEINSLWDESLAIAENSNTGSTSQVQ